MNKALAQCALRLLPVSHADLQALNAGSGSRPEHWPLFLMVRQDAPPHAGLPVALELTVALSARSCSLRLSAVRYRRPDSAIEERMQFREEHQLTRLAGLPEVHGHAVFVAADDLRSESCLQMPDLEKLAAQCARHGEWRLMHILEWELARRAHAEGLRPQLPRRLPAGCRWQLLGPRIRGACRPELQLDWILLRQRPGAAGRAQPLLRLLTGSDGTPDRVLQDPGNCAGDLLGTIPVHRGRPARAA